ncbi:MAG TPA: carboxylesterase family protein [Solirubrobacteraceae bacterium]|jgi:para-nitrobenzyl esterase|nr:carboxylesterase family protein [Solirubrobacteraceae bacterium]
MSEPVAQTTSGTLRGSGDGEIASFLGVPFAEPPLGELRWRAPAPIEARSGVIDAVVPAPPAPQPERPIGHRSHGDLPPGEEDCLRMNIWTPSERGDGGLPVFVWLHGGGFVLGSPSVSLFDGASLARALGAVVAIPGYRLGSLGWLHHPALGAPSGNWGLLDQLAALQWLHANAAALGGDPQRIVLAGESAGALSVVHLLGMAATDGRVQRVLAMSPPLGESTIAPELATRWAEELARTLTGGAFDPQALRSRSAQEIVEAHERLIAEGPFGGTRGGALPVADRATIAHAPLEAAGIQPQVDVLVGTNADEATFFHRQPGRVTVVDDAGLEAIVARQPGIEDAAAAIAARRAELPGADNTEILVRIATDAIFAGPIERWTDARRAGGGSVHSYRIEHRSPQPGLGAVHTIGVPLLFGSHHSSLPGAWVAGEEAAADAVSAALRTATREFVHTGSPGWGTGEVGVFGGADGSLRVEKR